MEEWVGKHWHNFVSNKAGQNFALAEVELETMKPRLSILFRALSGLQGSEVKQATSDEWFGRRTSWQRLAGRGKHVVQSWCDEDGPRLPPKLAVFPIKALNESLYCWLAVLASTPRVAGRGVLADSVCQVQTTLQRYPALRQRYVHLARQYHNLRQQLQVKGDNERFIEQAICNALLHPEQDFPTLPPTVYEPAPVPLWLQAPKAQLESYQGSTEEQVDESVANASNEGNESKKRQRGERTDMPDAKGGLLSFRLESLFSWTEYMPVDRPTDDSDDDNSEQSANDMDVITVARDRLAGAQKIKLDLDLPSEAYDDIRLGEGILLPEWDYRRGRLVADHCLLQEMSPRNCLPSALPEHLMQPAHRLRRQFETLLPQRQWQSRRRDGDELDLSAYVDFCVKQQQSAIEQPAVYRQLENKQRDLSCLLLADFSASTDAWINSDSRVIDVVQDALLLFSEALSACRDRFAMYGFASRNRNHVRFYRLKQFADSYDANVRGNILGLEPCYYTRMGAAIRHASSLLEKEASAQRLLLLLTDGKPNDIDKYESRYGVEDTRQAVLEARDKGLQAFCVTIDDKAEDYLPYLFGSKQWLQVRNIEELPGKLLQLYAQLTH